MLHYPPWYGSDRALASLEMFSREVMPHFAGAAGYERQARAASGTA
jgi:hypothetical protein